MTRINYYFGGIMTWGLFSTVHIISLFISAAIIVGVYFLLKLLPEKARLIALFILSLAGISAIIFNLIAWDSPLEYLPLHMCSITAMLLPVVVLTRSKVLGNLLLVWCLGALIALVVHNIPECVIPSATFFFYYIPHTFEFAVVIYLFKFKYIKAEPKYIPSTVGITVGIYTLVHLTNVILNNHFVANGTLDRYGNPLQVNYMFSVSPIGNPVLEIFYKIIPHSYWYMYLAIVVLVVYLGCLFLPKIIISKIKSKNNKKDA